MTAGRRRAARPVRIALARVLGGDIDGAWWPHSGSIADELPGLIEALHAPLGEIVDISINWAETDAVPDLNSMRSGAKSLPGCAGGHQRLMVIDGRRNRVRLLVVPHRTLPALGSMVLRQAAALPISDTQASSEVFDTAGRVVRIARAESAGWAVQPNGACTPDGHAPSQAVPDGAANPKP